MTVWIEYPVIKVLDTERGPEYRARRPAGGALTSARAQPPAALLWLRYFLPTHAWLVSFSLFLIGIR